MGCDSRTMPETCSAQEVVKVERKTRYERVKLKGEGGRNEEAHTTKAHSPWCHRTTMKKLSLLEPWAWMHA